VKPKKWYQQEVSLGILRVSTVDIVLMTKHLSVMLEAGLTLSESIEVLYEQATGLLRRVMRRVYIRIDQGASFADAISKEPRVFGPVFVSAVLVGENSGTLADNLKRLAVQMEKSLKIRRDIQSAMLYPAVVVTMTVLLGLGVAIYVLPQIAAVFRSLRVDLPWTTRMLIKVAEIFESNGLLIGIIFIAAVIFLVWLVQQKFMRPFVHSFILELPIIGNFIHDIQRAQLCRMLGTLIASGTPISETLQISADATSNYIYQKSVRYMHNRVISGDNFADIVGVYPKLYPGIIKQMVSVGERSGSLGETLNYLADFYEDRVENTAKNISSLIEPILLIFIGALVGLIAVSILTPIYSILGSVRG
ncbi:MAG: type II secretion system F family protein, partial [Patescibacteria group bacterium]